MKQNLVTVTEVAKRLKVHEAWVRKRVRNEEIPFYRIGVYIRFDEQEIEEWIEQQKVTNFSANKSEEKIFEVDKKDEDLAKK